MKEINNIIPLISVAIALMAVIIGPFVTLYISKKQVEASIKASRQQTISPMRQAWINNMREIIVEFLIKIQEYDLFIIERNNEKDIEKAIKDFIRIESKLKLLINPNEENHVELIKIMDKIIDIVDNEKINEENREKLMDKYEIKIVEISQEILKSEWNVVKEGK